MNTVKLLWLSLLVSTLVTCLTAMPMAGDDDGGDDYDDDDEVHIIDLDELSDDDAQKEIKQLFGNSHPLGSIKELQELLKGI